MRQINPNGFQSLCHSMYDDYFVVIKNLWLDFDMRFWNSPRSTGPDNSLFLADDVHIQYHSKFCWAIINIIVDSGKCSITQHLPLFPVWDVYQQWIYNRSAPERSDMPKESEMKFSRCLIVQKHLQTLIDLHTQIFCCISSAHHIKCTVEPLYTDHLSWWS